MKQNTSKDKTETSEKDNSVQWSHQVVDGLNTLFRSAISFASGLISFLGIIYFMGWSYSQGYFSKFDATWLTQSLSLIQILEFSKTPILVVVIFFSVTATHVFENQFIPRENFLFYHFNKFFWGYSELLYFVAF